METLDEQLDAANAKVAELTDRVAGLEASLQEAASKQGVLETANAELTDNLTATKDKLAAQEIQLRDALAEVEKLKADAEAAAKRMVALEMQAEDRRSRHDTSNTGRGRDSGTRISSSVASVGGGGRSILIGVARW